MTIRRRLLIAMLLLLPVTQMEAYSVLSHEAMVDALWDVRIQSLLLARFPNASAEQLKIAHGYAYGGAIIQDLGYYPHGSEQFSDLTHYVRSGDFIRALLQEAKDLNETSFALGSLSHYLGDMDGHRYATNLAEPVLYPRLRRKFGPVVTYEDKPAYHVKTEYGFDVLEAAKGNFAPQSYHDWIGFYVSKDLIGRAFHDTYGLELADLFQDFDVSISSYRSTVSRIIPEATKIAWTEHRKEIEQSQPGMTQRRFVYIMKRSSYEKEWGKRREEPTLLDKFLAFVIRILPPIGPLADLKLKIPTPQVEKLFMASFARASDNYHKQLNELPKRELTLADVNYDVGTITRVGEYFLDDATQALWLHKLAEKKFATVTPDIRRELIGYFGDLSAPMKLKNKPGAWKQLQSDYAALRK